MLFQISSYKFCFFCVSWVGWSLIAFPYELCQADIDNNGSIDYGEFLAATLHLNKMEREENLVAAFAYFDKDGSGYITIDELQQACKDFSLGDVHLDEMIKEIDQDNVSSSNCVCVISSTCRCDCCHCLVSLTTCWFHF